MLRILLTRPLRVMERRAYESEGDGSLCVSLFNGSPVKVEIEGDPFCVVIFSSLNVASHEYLRFI